MTLQIRTTGLLIILLSYGFYKGKSAPPTKDARPMLAQLKLDIANETDVLAARHLTLVRTSLWDQAEPVAAGWADANPEKAMAYLMVTQSEDLLGR
jgi:hypothetical protein